MDSCRTQESQSIGSMRKMLLIQEEIFKHQVQELHRLYTLQKHLMQELEYRVIRDNLKESSSADEKDLKRIEEDNANVEVELTLSIGRCPGIKRSENHSDRDQEQLGHSSRKTSNGVECNESGFHRKKMRQHWLLQDLSLHRT